MRPTIADVRALQARLGAAEQHVVYFDDDGFVLAHTDWERQWFSDLQTCPLHRWLTDVDEMPVKEPGYYFAARRSSTTPWSFAKLDV